MTKRRSYRGKVVDIDEIMRNNENTQAVGNANMNARGDILDDRGNIKQTREERAREYNRNVSSSVVKSSLLDDIDEVIPEPKQTPKKAQQAPKNPKQAPKKNTVDEDFDDVGGDAGDVTEKDDTKGE